MLRAMSEDTEIKGERIAKALARAGVASRREVERLIEEGRVKMHGKRLETPATLITSLDGITVDGKPVQKAEETKLVALPQAEGHADNHTVTRKGVRRFLTICQTIWAG